MNRTDVLRRAAAAAVIGVAAQSDGRSVYIGCSASDRVATCGGLTEGAMKE